MDDLTDFERRRRRKATAMLAYLQLEGKHTEVEIAQKLGFGSPEAMRVQLRNWGLPAWLIGESEAELGVGRAPKRKARTGAGETPADLSEVERALSRRRARDPEGTVRAKIHQR